MSQATHPKRLGTSVEAAVIDADPDLETVTDREAEWYRQADLVQGLVHVTGGGLPGNLRRVVPEECEAVVDYDAWERPALFSLIQSEGDVPEADMRQTFNLGVGLGERPPRAR